MTFQTDAFGTNAASATTVAAAHSAGKAALNPPVPATNSPVTLPSSATDGLLDEPTKSADAFRRAALAGNTLTAYRSDWADFQRWCASRGVDPLPAEPAAVGAYLADLAELGRAPSTIGRRLAAVNKVHQWSGHPPPGQHPAVSLTLDGIRRSVARPVRRMAPLLLADLRMILDGIDTDSSPGGAIGRRDRLLLLAGWALACRRSELAALRVSDITVDADGLTVRIRRSKTDQVGAGHMKALPVGNLVLTCPVCAYTDWRRLVDDADRRGRVGLLAALERPAARISHDHEVPADADLDPDRRLLRGVRAGGHLAGAISGHAVNRVVKRRLPQSLDAARFGAHSLRARFVTEAARRGADNRSIRRQTGQSSDRVVEAYIREHAPLIGNAVATVGPMTSRLPEPDPGWALYRDWCVAIGRVPLPTDPGLLAAFDARFPAAPATQRRRRRAVLRAHLTAGHPVRQSGSVPAVGAGAAAVLSSIQVRGWPGGVSGRRDAFLIALRMHLTRPELARADAVAVLAVLADTTLGTEPGGCLRCGLTRWLRVLAVASVGGWRSVQRRMAGQFPAAAGDETGHDCQRQLRPGWRLMPLLPAVDRHGNVDVTGPISGRAITAATSRRRQQRLRNGASPASRNQPEPPVRPPAPSGARWDRADTVRDMHWLDHRLDHLEALVADLDAAIAAANRAAAGPTDQLDGTG